MILIFIKKVLNQIIAVLFYVALLFMFFVIGSAIFSGGEPYLFGYQIKTVLSGSMEPNIKTGSIIIVKTGGDPTAFKKNDIITFKAEENRIVTHRILDVIEKNGQTMYRMKGDNNKTKDMNLVLPQNIIGKYTDITIPYIGYFIEFTKSKGGSLLLFLIPGLLLFGYSLITIWKTFIQPKREDSPNSAASIK